MVCSTCASPVAAGQRFCSNCEKPLSTQWAQSEKPYSPPSVIEDTTQQLEGSSLPWTAEAAAVQTAAHPEGIISKIKRHKIGVSLTLAMLLLLTVVISLVALFRPSNQATINQDIISSVAIIPFSCCNRIPEDLSERISENVRNNLSQLSQVKIIAPGSRFKYRQPDGDPWIMGTELGASAVLKIRAVQSGIDDFSINAELINTRDRRLLWGEQYHRRVTDLQTVQTEISREIIEKLKPRLTNEKQ